MKPLPKHILIIRLSLMGDVALTVPVIRALRKKYPEVKITVLTRTSFAPFFRGIHDMRFFHLNLKVRHKGLWGLFRLAADARKDGIDAVADMHDNTSSRIIRNLLSVKGCRTAHIDKGLVSKRRLCRKGYLNFHQLKTTSERYADVLRDLGFELTPQPDIDMALPVPLAINYLHGKKSGPWIGIAPFAKYDTKIYPIDQMEQVAAAIADRAHKVFIFGGGDDEQRLAARIASQRDNIVSVIDVMGLGDELNLIANLDVMLTMDSVSMQMGSLVGTPVVSVWGGTHPYAGFYGLGQDPDRAVQLPLECRPCSVNGNRPCRFTDLRCLTGIAPETIVDRVWRVYDSIKN
ncbi:MAG: glycosyltransferase family 9 protein [Alistipes sp.]|jgi:ADP-heptose:LPS heptosyltransferase|nr:glycosyltransferase family 9 protein [Alistipes sp.]